jgi:hypothetical protein
MNNDGKANGPPLKAISKVLLVRGKKAVLLGNVKLKYDKEGSMKKHFII